MILLSLKARLALIKLFLNLFYHFTIWSLTRNTQACENRTRGKEVLVPSIQPINLGGRTRLDPRNPSDPSGSESDLTWFFKKVKLIRIWSEPDPTRDQMIFNPIKIYQRSEKTQHISWPDPIWFLLKGQTDPTRPIRTRTRPDRLPPLNKPISQYKAENTIA
jgi:hypothetical protein